VSDEVEPRVPHIPWGIDVPATIERRVADARNLNAWLREERARLRRARAEGEDVIALPVSLAPRVGRPEE
jgi:hypothetical protein